MQWLPASVGQEGTAQREHTCPRAPRALHPHFEAPRSPLDATVAQAAQAETTQRTQTARREDKTTNQQTMDLLNSPPVQRQASSPALLLTAPPAPPPGSGGTRVHLHSPLWSRSTRPRSGGSGIVLRSLVLLLSRSGPRRSATLARSPPLQHHDDPGCFPCAEGAPGALQKIAPAPHLMPLGMAPCSCAQYDLAGHIDGPPLR